MLSTNTRVFFLPSKERGKKETKINAKIMLQSSIRPSIVPKIPIHFPSFKGGSKCSQFQSNRVPDSGCGLWTPRCVRALGPLLSLAAKGTFAHATHTTLTACMPCEILYLVC